MKTGYVYILASQPNGTLYVGVTSNLIRRVHQHREGTIKGFSAKYGAKRLVYFEQFEAIEDAIQRERRMKKWRRKWKLELIEKNNPNWEDLYPRLAGFPLSRE